MLDDQPSDELLSSSVVGLQTDWMVTAEKAVMLSSKNCFSNRVDITLWL